MTLEKKAVMKPTCAPNHHPAVPPRVTAANLMISFNRCLLSPGCLLAEIPPRFALPPFAKGGVAGGFAPVETFGLAIHLHRRRRFAQSRQDLLIRHAEDPLLLGWELHEQLALLRSGLRDGATF